MKKGYFLSAIVCILLLVLAFTSSKKFRAQKGQVSTSATLKQGEPWFAYDFTAIHILNSAEIQYRKTLTEVWYTEFLRANENTKHEVAYVWERIAGDKVVYRIKAFITPPPGLEKSVSGGVTISKPDPPSPPPPPPPETTW